MTTVGVASVKLEGSGLIPNQASFTYSSNFSMYNVVTLVLPPANSGVMQERRVLLIE